MKFSFLNITVSRFNETMCYEIGIFKKVCEFAKVFFISFDTFQMRISYNEGPNYTLSDELQSVDDVYADFQENV